MDLQQMEFDLYGKQKNKKIKKMSKSLDIFFVV